MGTPQRTNVFIVEDSATVRARLVELIDDLDGVRVVGEAETPADAAAGILAKRPDCVVLDFQLTGGTAIEVLREVRLKAPEIVFIVLTNHPTAQHRRACMEAGASYFFDKSIEFGRIKNVIAGLVSA